MRGRRSGLESSAERKSPIDGGSRRGRGVLGGIALDRGPDQSQRGIGFWAGRRWVSARLALAQSSLARGPGQSWAGPYCETLGSWDCAVGGTCGSDVASTWGLVLVPQP